MGTSSRTPVLLLLATVVAAVVVASSFLPDDVEAEEDLCPSPSSFSRWCSITELLREEVELTGRSSSLDLV